MYRIEIEYSDVVHPPNPSLQFYESKRRQLRLNETDQRLRARSISLRRLFYYCHSGNSTEKCSLHSGEPSFSYQFLATAKAAPVVALRSTRDRLILCRVSIICDGSEVFCPSERKYHTPPHRDGPPLLIPKGDLPRIATHTVD